jgi:hypothetical protein
MAYSFRHTPVVLWTGVALFGATLILRWTLVRFATPPEALR